MVANVARYHRRALPQRSTRDSTPSLPSCKRIVRILSALLRIADGLDRTHFSVVRTLDVKTRRHHQNHRACDGRCGVGSLGRRRGARTYLNGSSVAG